MASRLERLRHLIYAASACLLGIAGCAFPHGATGGDPLLGSFNRPIVPTPPPERGGLGLDSPAYDAGARIGISAPEIPVAAEPPARFPTVPPAKGPVPSTGTRAPFASPDTGDRFTSGPLVTPPHPTAAVRPVRYEVIRDPSKVATLEEAQALLELLGARSQRTEQREDGVWVSSCTFGQKVCQARAREPLDAMRMLLEQVEKER